MMASDEVDGRAMPRNYNSEKRKQLESELRQRIVEATVALHAEKGPVETSYRDIAQKADVSIPTVYKNFPDLRGLFLACTRHAASMAPEQSEEMFAGLESLRERIAALVHARCKAHLYFDPWFRWGGERVVPEIISLLQEDGVISRRLIRKALLPAYPNGRPPREIMSMTLLLLGYQAWAGLQTQGGISQKQIEAYLTNSICRLAES
jgi:AcrR family transcriptional regulator